MGRRWKDYFSCFISLVWLSVNHTGYHWDISDWIPSVQMCHIQGLLHSDFVQTPPPSGYIRPIGIDTDYLTSGLDIESKCTSAPQYPADVQLSPVPRLPESCSLTQPNRDIHTSAERESPSGSETAHSLIQRTRLDPPLTLAVPQGSDDDGDDTTFSISSPILSCSDVSAYSEDCDSMSSDCERMVLPVT